MSETNSQPSRRELRERARRAEEARKLAEAAAEVTATAEGEALAVAEAAQNVEVAQNASASGSAETAQNAEAGGKTARRRRVRLNHAAEGPVDVPYIRTSPEYFAPVANDGDAPLTRRTLRLQADHQAQPVANESAKDAVDAKPADAKPGAAKPSDAASAIDSVPTNSMSLEQITAVREVLAAQVVNQTAGIEAVRREDPNAISVREIQEHQELAAKAAAVEAQLRAKDKARTEAQNSPEVPSPSAAQQAQPRQPSEAEQSAPSAPSARAANPSEVDNLAMVTPLEFEQVPGSNRPVMKRPATSHVPVVTNANQVSTRRRTSRSPLTGRIKRVEAEQWLRTPPVEAKDAHGLEPLAASERAPVSRTKFYVAQAVLLAIGVGTLVTGIILILQSMNR